MDTSEPSSPVTIPDYTLIRPIGKGSYGEVWLARSALGQYRAIKIVRREKFTSERPFERELSGIKRFEPISRSHPGFLDILHAGVSSEAGIFYYVMELADDVVSGREIDPERYEPKTLASVLARELKLTVAKSLEIAISLADGLSHLHSHGLVHRDVKPSNVIFLDGMAKLGDIGLVALMADAKTYVGTEGYIAPEGPGSAQADIFALGKVLYETCTGHDRTDFPKLPTLIEEHSEYGEFMEFNEILLRSSHPDIKERYRTASGMRSDLLLLQSGHSVRQIRKLKRRAVIYARLAAAIALLFGLCFPAAYFFKKHHERLGLLALHEGQVRDREVGGLIAAAAERLDQGDLYGAVRPLVSALTLDSDPAEQELQRFRLGITLARAPRLISFSWHTNRINWVEFHPEGGVVAAEFFNKLHFLQEDGTARLCAVDPGDSLLTASLSYDGKIVVAANKTGLATTWDWSSGTQLDSFPHPTDINSARFNRSGTHLVTAGDTGNVYLWQVSPRQLQQTIKAHTKGVLYATFSDNGELIASSSRDGTVRVWNAKTGEAHGGPYTHGTWVFHVSFSPDMTRLVSSGFDKRACVWDLEKESFLFAIPHRDAVLRSEFSPDGRFILSASTDGTVRLSAARPERGFSSTPVLYHNHRVTHATFSRDARRILTACVDGTIRIWDLASTVWAPEPQPGIQSPNGVYSLLSHSNLTEIEIHHPTHNEVVGRITHSPEGETVRFDESGRAVVSRNQATPQKLTLFSLDPFKKLAGIESDASPGDRLFFSPKNLRLFISKTNVVEVRDARTGKFLHAPLVFSKPISNFTVSADGSHALVGFKDQYELWAFESKARKVVAKSVPGEITHFEFSPDGASFVVCSSDDNFSEHAAELLNVLDGSLVRAPLLHRDGVLYATFSQNGQFLVTCGEDQIAMVWNLSDSNKPPRILQHENQVLYAHFADNDRLILTVSANEMLRVWDARSGYPLTSWIRTFEVNHRPIFLNHSFDIAWNGASGGSSLLKLRTVPGTQEDLAELATFLTGDDRNVFSNKKQAFDLLATWKTLKQRSAFPLVEENAHLIWHHYLNRLSIEEQDAIGTRFHSSFLSAGTP